MKGFVYILTNKNNTVLYTGVTSDLKGSAYLSIKEKNTLKVSLQDIISSKLVYFESFETNW